MLKPSKIEIIRHSVAHILAAAVQKLYPEAKFGVGPIIENGFYYDIDLPCPLSEQDLPKIEKAMRGLIQRGVKFEKEELSFEEAIKLFEKIKQPYKVKLIEDLKKEVKNGKLAENKVALYKTGDFIDLCRGPHVASTKEINPDAFKLTKIAGAYWKGNEKNKMLTRIYGIAFESKKELDDYQVKQAEAKKRDHRLIGQKLELFMFDEETGQGLPLWLPKGAFIRHKIMEFAFNAYLENGYQPVSTPHIASEELWSHSGHLGFYKEEMYDSFGIDDKQYRLKPMNCPLHVKMYNHRPRSYRELPLRWTEMGTVYRYEKSGVLHGLTRVRGFTQDDAHIICSSEQLHRELVEALKLTLYILKTFGFKNFEMNLSVRNKDKSKFIGSDKDWNEAESALKKALAEVGFKDFILDVGGAIFYGPKIDIKVADSLDRMWQLSTIQFDFNLPGRFKMKYVGKDGKEHEPYMIHRALLGSLERFMGVYIEHTAGNFPVWLAPVQARIIPIGKKFNKYAEEVAKQLKKENIRIEIDDSNETLGKKIREGETQKIPYLLIVGEKEEKSKTLAPRQRKKGNLGAMEVEKFVEKIREEVEGKK